MSAKAVKLGDEIEDVTSKMVGIAIGRVEYLSGTVCWIVQPYTTDDNQMLRTQEVPDEYCIYKGAGVYPTPRPPAGFHVRNKKEP